MKIYFQINKLNLLIPLIRAIENCGSLYSQFSMADKVTYNYYLGRKAMFDSDLVLGKFAVQTSVTLANSYEILFFLNFIAYCDNTK